MPAPRAELQRAYRRLIGGLAFFELSHLLGLISASLWLLPGLSPTLPSAERASYIVSNLIWWRLGWLPWQLSAVSDVWVAAALIGWTRALGAPRARRWAWCGAGGLLLAIVPEQCSEAALVASFPSASGRLWSELLTRYMWLLGTWANSGYTLMTGCWLLALRSLANGEPSALRASGRAPIPAGVWPRWAEATLLSLFLASSLTNHLAWSPRTAAEHAGAFQLTSLFNALAFPGLLLLGVAIAMRAGDWQARELQPEALRPRWHREGSRFGTWLSALAGSPGLRDLVRSVQSRLPFPRLRSDVGNVLYLNWLVPADLIEARLFAGLRVRRFGDATLLSILVFRHGHFGPALLGPLRRLLPSPIQCNARAYLEAPGQHVTFLANSIDHLAYFLGSRLLCDGLPVHYPASARLERSGSRLSVALAAGHGSALALRAQVSKKRTTARSRQHSQPTSPTSTRRSITSCRRTRRCACCRRRDSGARRASSTLRPWKRRAPAASSTSSNSGRSWPISCSTPSRSHSVSTAYCLKSLARHAHSSARSCQHDIRLFIRPSRT
jgi:hypothetical protein